MTFSNLRNRYDYTDINMEDLRQDRIVFDCFGQSNTVNQHLIHSMFNGALNDFVV